MEEQGKNVGNRPQAWRRLQENCGPFCKETQGIPTESSLPVKGVFGMHGDGAQDLLRPPRRG